MSGITRTQETALIDDILIGLNAALEETGAELGDNDDDEFRQARDIRVNKLVHQAIDRFELPILWSWYRYGQSIARREVMGWNVSPESLHEGTDDPCRAKREIYPGARSPERYMQFFIDEVSLKEMEETGLEAICTLDLNEFLENVYDDAPDDGIASYRRLYHENLRIQTQLDEMWASDGWLDECSRFSDEVWDATYTLQNIILHREEFGAETTTAVSEYVRLFRNVVTAFAENDEIAGEDGQSVITNVAKVYHDQVWKAVAMTISSETVEGPGKNRKCVEWNAKSDDRAANAIQAVKLLRENIHTSGLVVYPQQHPPLPDDEVTHILADIEKEILI